MSRIGGEFRFPKLSDEIKTAKEFGYEVRLDKFDGNTRVNRASLKGGYISLGAAIDLRVAQSSPEYPT